MGYGSELPLSVPPGRIGNDDTERPGRELWGFSYDLFRLLLDNDPATLPLRSIRSTR